MEYDGGSTITLTLSVKDTSGNTVSIQFAVKDNDDSLGATSFDKRDVPRSRTNPYHTGSTKFYVRWSLP